SGFGNYCCKRGAGLVRSLMRQPKCSDLHGLKFTILRRSAERLVTGLRATYYAYRQIRNEELEIDCQSGTIEPCLNPWICKPRSWQLALGLYLRLLVLRI